MVRGPSLDVSVPVLLFQVSRYSFLYGSLGAIRSLGRVGVPTHAMITSSLAPHQFSRYLDRSFPVDFDQDNALEQLQRIARQLGRPAILMPTDDAAAVYAARHAQEIKPFFILPSVAPELPQALANKRDLYEMCTAHNVPAPWTAFAGSIGETLALAANASFPIVIKNSEPFSCLSRPSVTSTTIIRTHAELLRLIEQWTGQPQIVVQEYVPRDVAEDWIVHIYCGREGIPLAAFTGRKHRSWPPEAGVTTAATALPNEELLALATGFCRDIGYRGIADMDWRFDRRDGRYKLVDFNPRLGANFRLFVTENDIDVVRAQHLDLTGRPVSASPQVFGRRFTVENLDLASRLLQFSGPLREPEELGKVMEFAWFAIDDPVPFLVMLLRFGALVLSRATQTIVARMKTLVSSVLNRPWRARESHTDV